MQVTTTLVILFARTDFIGFAFSVWVADEGNPIVEGIVALQDSAGAQQRLIGNAFGSAAPIPLIVPATVFSNLVSLPDPIM
jgi:hypothetical protein